MNHRKMGVCEKCSNRFTDQRCTHATETEKEYTRALDEAWENSESLMKLDVDLDSIYNKYFPVTSKSSLYVKGSIKANGNGFDLEEIAKIVSRYEEGCGNDTADLLASIR